LSVWAPKKDEDEGLREGDDEGEDSPEGREKVPKIPVDAVKVQKDDDEIFVEDAISKTLTRFQQDAESKITTTKDDMMKTMEGMFAPPPKKK
jgi:DNA-binding protein YbaB